MCTKKDFICIKTQKPSVCWGVEGPHPFCPRRGGAGLQEAPVPPPATAHTGSAPHQKEGTALSFPSPPGPSTGPGTLVSGNVNRTEPESSSSRAPRGVGGSPRRWRPASLPAASRTRVSGSKAVDTESASSFPAWFRFWLLTLSAKDKVGIISYEPVSKNCNDRDRASGWRSALALRQRTVAATAVSPLKLLIWERQEVP